MIELRWAVTDKTSTQPPVLQWRYRLDPGPVRWGGPPPQWTPWTTVPTVVVPESEKNLPTPPIPAQAFPQGALGNWPPDVKA